MTGPASQLPSLILTAGPSRSKMSSCRVMQYVWPSPHIQWRGERRVASRAYNRANLGSPAAVACWVRRGRWTNGRRSHNFVTPLARPARRVQGALIQSKPLPPNTHSSRQPLPTLPGPTLAQHTRPHFLHNSLCTSLHHAAAPQGAAPRRAQKRRATGPARGAGTGRLEASETPSLQLGQQGARCACFCGDARVRCACDAHGPAGRFRHLAAPPGAAAARQQGGPGASRRDRPRARARAKVFREKVRPVSKPGHLGQAAGRGPA
jgi:hypothetical protein